MLENFLWKSSVIVKLQVYTNSSLKNYLGLKCHKTYFAENFWVAVSDVSCIYFCFFLNFLETAEKIWLSDN